MGEAQEEGYCGGTHNHRGRTSEELFKSIGLRNDPVSSRDGLHNFFKVKLFHFVIL